MDSAIGFADGGLLIGLGADIGKKMSSDFPNRITSANNTSPNRNIYFGDPISMFGFQATTVMPTFEQRFENNAHSYPGLQIAGKVPVHDTPGNNLTPSPEDSKAEVITE